MRIKDIVNRDLVNLTNCEQEPIHIPGSIQPHGFLLGLKEDTFIVEYCSENCVDYTGLLYTELLGNSFKNIFGAKPEQSLVEYISKDLMLSSNLLSLELAGKEFLCTLHKKESIYILEAEPVNSSLKEASQVYDQTSQFLAYMHDTHTLKELCQLVARGTREITGYDRVMVYRFDENYNGEVFAESRNEDFEPFLGLHYPHTDIPAQARELYMQNLLRLITDINYTPVPIYTIDDAPNKNLDLSLSILRSTSPIHVQYLQNMGVGATLTISLIYQKKLWGLIACHHYSPKNLTPEIRLAAQLQGHFITSQIDLRQSSEEYEVTRKATAALEKMNSFSLADGIASFTALIRSPHILHLCNASGVSIIYNGYIFKNGLTPVDDDVRYLASKLIHHSSNGSFHTNKLIDIFPGQKGLCSNVSGIIYHSLNKDTDCIIWYRPETKTEINWGGDPNKSIIKDKNGLSPRNSFKLWKEIVDCMSKPWQQPELDTAAAYANSLQRQINLHTITLEEEKYRKLSELLKAANSELENINWISTHDLQEPLRKIQLLASRTLSKEPGIPENVQETIKRMNSSANRMQTLLVDILKYTRLKHSEGSFEDLNLIELLEEVKTDMAESINESNANIVIHNLPYIYGHPFLIKQLFSNLIANSIKYASPDRNPVITITAFDEPVIYKNPNELYHVIHFSDNGIGFDQEYAESVFNIFTRLHTTADYKGSGVGLALCKKIMQNHNGHISAVSRLNEGTVISVYFPVN